MIWDHVGFSSSLNIQTNILLYMNSKRIGNIGEAKVLAKFVEMGMPVYIPFGDNEKADLVAECPESSI